MEKESITIHFVARMNQKETMLSFPSTAGIFISCVLFV